MCDILVCRICLQTGVRGYTLEEHNLRSYYEYVIRQKVNCREPLPQWVCYECATILHKFHKFKEKCLHGQILLRQIARREEVNYKSVATIDRLSENLESSLGNVVPSHRVQTVNTKHKHKINSDVGKLVEFKKVIVDVDRNVIEVKKLNILDTIDLDNKKPEVIIEKIEIKTEEPLDELKVEDLDNTEINPVVKKHAQDEKITNVDMSNTNIDTNSTHKYEANLNNDIDTTDHIHNAVSSDDENLLLDIVKKAVIGENKLVFLDNIESEPVKKKRKYTKKSEKSKGKVHKFEKQKKEILSPEHWRKFNLTEEEAMHEFKQREQNDQYVNANYKCHICYKGFSKVEMLMRHAKFRHDESCGPFECRFCRMRFNQKNKLCKHLKQHYTVFQCLRCDMRFRLESSATFHEDYHNGVVRKCKYCGEEFKHSSTYYTHVRMSHRSAHVCVACGASFVSAAGLQQHTRIKHYDHSDEAPSKTEQEQSNTYCGKCDIKFASAAAYDEHLTHSDMHGDLNTESETARANMKGNKRVVQGFRGLRKKKPTTCQYCGKHFSTQGQCMKHHLAEHPRRSFYPPDKRHICEVCGQSLAAVSIASHMNRHTREHVYPCSTCGMQFYSKSSHHRHQVTHTGERPYPCTLCEKRFTQRNSMKLHYRTFHLKEPYPKRNRRKKTDVEVPIMEFAMNRDRMPQMLECNRDSNSPPPARWRPSF